MMRALQQDWPAAAERRLRLPTHQILFLRRKRATAESVEKPQIQEAGFLIRR